MPSHLACSQTAIAGLPFQTSGIFCQFPGLILNNRHLSDLLMPCNSLETPVSMLSEACPFRMMVGDIFIPSFKVENHSVFILFWSNKYWRYKLMGLWCTFRYDTFVVQFLYFHAYDTSFRLMQTSL